VTGSAILRFVASANIYLIPDVPSNAVGVIFNYFEWVQDLQSIFWNKSEIGSKLFRILKTSWTQSLNQSREEKVFTASTAYPKPKGSADYFREAVGKLPSAKCFPMR
jgi:glutamate dehydrogenase/leucine dehydrogenase